MTPSEPDGKNSNFDLKYIDNAGREIVISLKSVRATRDYVEAFRKNKVTLVGRIDDREVSLSKDSIKMLETFEQMEIDVRRPRLRNSLIDSWFFDAIFSGARELGGLLGLLVARRRATAAASSLTALAKLTDWVPFPSVRKKQRKLLADEFAEIDEFRSQGRYFLVRWRTAWAWVLWARYLLTAPLSYAAQAFLKATGGK